MSIGFNISAELNSHPIWTIRRGPLRLSVNWGLGIWFRVSKYSHTGTWVVFGLGPVIAELDLE